MFAQALKDEFQAAGFTADDETFLSGMFDRFPDVQKGFERSASYPRAARPILTMFNMKKTLRAGWKRIGVPEEDVQTVADHSGTCAILARVNDHDMHVSMIMMTHDMSESVVTDFTPHDPITSSEKHRLERLGLVFALAESPVKDETLALWSEYEEQKTPASHVASDIDKLEMLLQAQIYGRDYPQLNEKLQEFWNYVEPRLKTDWGRAFYADLKQRHPEPHPVKVHLARPYVSPYWTTEGQHNNLDQ